MRVHMRACNMKQAITRTHLCRWVPGMKIVGALAAAERRASRADGDARTAPVVGAETKQTEREKKVSLLMVADITVITRTTLDATASLFNSADISR